MTCLLSSGGGYTFTVQVERTDFVLGNAKRFYTIEDALGAEGLCNRRMAGDEVIEDSYASNATTTSGSSLRGANN